MHCRHFPYSKNFGIFLFSGIKSQIKPTFTLNKLTILIRKYVDLRNFVVNMLRVAFTHFCRQIHKFARIGVGRLNEIFHCTK